MLFFPGLPHLGPGVEDDPLAGGALQLVYGEGVAEDERQHSALAGSPVLEPVLGQRGDGDGLGQAGDEVGPGVAVKGADDGGGQGRRGLPGPVQDVVHLPLAAVGQACLGELEMLVAGLAGLLAHPFSSTC